MSLRIGKTCMRAMFSDNPNLLFHFNSQCNRRIRVNYLAKNTFAERYEN